MKKLFVLLMLVTSLMMFSCTNELEQRIIDHEQTLDENTVIDLSMKIVSLEKVQDVLVKDSIFYLKNKIDTLKMRFYPEEDISVIINDTIKKDLSHLVETYSKLHKRKPYDSFYEENYKSWKYTEELYLSYVNLLEKYENSNKEKLGEIWKCVYTIKNPILNNAEQKITNTYFITDETIKNCNNDVFTIFDF